MSSSTVVDKNSVILQFWGVSVCTDCTFQFVRIVHSILDKTLDKT